MATFPEAPLAYGHPPRPATEESMVLIPICGPKNPKDNEMKKGLIYLQLHFLVTYMVFKILLKHYSNQHKHSAITLFSCSCSRKLNTPCYSHFAGFSYHPSSKGVVQSQIHWRCSFWENIELGWFLRKLKQTRWNQSSSDLTTSCMSHGHITGHS